MQDPTAATADHAAEIWLHHYGYPASLDDVRALADRFNLAHPDHPVRIVGLDYRELPAAVARAAEQGCPPAVAQYFYTSSQTALDMRDSAGQPLFTSVERAVGGRAHILGERVTLHDLVPAVRDYYTHGGELYSLPTHASTMLLYANTTLLEKAGVDEIPRSWDEVGAACRALAESGVPHGITWPNHGWIFQQAVAAQGGLLADADNGRSGRARRVDLSSAPMLAFVDWWQRLHHDGHYLYTGIIGDQSTAAEVWQANYEAFAQQQAAMVCSSSVEAERMVQAGRDGGFTVEAARMPHNAAAVYAGNVIGGDSLWLAAGLDSQRQDAALAFMQSLNEPRQAAERHQTGHYIPITGEALQLLDHEGWFTGRRHRRVAVEQMAAGDGSAASRGALLGPFDEIQVRMAQAMHDVLTGAAPAADRFAQATAAAQRLLDEYDEHCAGDGTARSPKHLSVG
ncbi:ABC transporter substrate-binding protein [Catellatospora methionotrophica]|uniref:ABC transporter substrate-binding protein n=2 Tax=Catellatospora methionotrophica TaxID=121620 RepID=A0A8J3LMC7_9ACTN|nr:extracellular solute-binding protein [Catellatospora methionotrophica]GIG18204.1 ABC transporter substrate-binding protein [Catellatospora methionotrophica]